MVARTAGAGNEAPAGVYGRYSARAVSGVPTVMFGLIDRSTYSDYDGKKGHYSQPNRGSLLRCRVVVI